jgi:asparaginyl-tRNA synthetase
VFRKVLDECEDDMAFFNQRIDNTVLERLTR